jgi:hypothetical protein
MLLDASARPARHDIFFTADEVAASLLPTNGRSIAAAAPERQALDPEGRTVTISDAGLRAVRRRE